ncbi:MAG: flagellar hook-length control protein FliK [Sandaracinaceae bacterium]
MTAEIVSPEGKDAGPEEYQDVDAPALLAKDGHPDVNETPDLEPRALESDADPSGILPRAAPPSEDAAPPQPERVPPSEHDAAPMRASVKVETERVEAERSPPAPRTEATKANVDSNETVDLTDGPTADAVESASPDPTSELTPVRGATPLAAPTSSRSAAPPETVDGASPPLPDAEEVSDPALAMRLMREANGVQRAEVALEHPMFGALRMELALDDGAVDLRMLVPSLAGALRLERDEGEMRALLRERGLRVASLEIDRPDPARERHEDVPASRMTEPETFVHHRYHWKA